MKKITLLLVLALCTFMYASAQEGGDDEFVSKRGINILPEAGDIALGINAVPIVSFFGNSFNGTANNAASFNFTDATNTIYAKYFLDDASALRIKLRLATGTVNDREFIMKDSVPIYDPLVNVEDIQSISTTNVILNIGYELRRGHGRVQGFYGGELMFAYGSGLTTYDYGNDYTSDFINPNTTNFGTNVTTTGRVLEQRAGKTLGIGLGAFIGVEYFFAPKLSVGGEFGWGLTVNKTGDGEIIEEQWTGLEVKEVPSPAGGGNAWGIDTDNAFGAIFLMFHF